MYIPVSGLLSNLISRNMESFISAVKAGDMTTLRNTNLSNQDLNRTDSEGFTPLYWAACYGHLMTCDWLIQNGADVNGSGVGSRPLHAAADRGQVDCIYLLLMSGADVNATTLENQDTALHLACYRGHEKTCRKLVDFGADLRALNSQNRTPKQEAQSQRHLTIVTLLHNFEIEKNRRRPVVTEDLSSFKEKVRNCSKSVTEPISLPREAIEHDERESPLDTGSTTYSRSSSSDSDCCSSVSSSDVTVSWPEELVNKNVQLTEDLHHRDDEIRRLRLMNSQLQVYASVCSAKQDELTTARRRYEEQYERAQRAENELARIKSKLRELTPHSTWLLSQLSQISGGSNQSCCSSMDNQLTSGDYYDHSDETLPHGQNTRLMFMELNSRTAEVEESAKYRISRKSTSL